MNNANVFAGYRVTSPYGPRKDPFTGAPTFHTGVDLVKAHRAPIYAFTAGTVVHAREGLAGTGFGGFGIVVAVRDKYGALHCYAHLDSVSVSVGQTVAAGQEIGKQGTTGRSTGSHLHYEVRTKSTPSFGFGSHTDPGAYLSDFISKETEEAEEMASLNGGVAETIIASFLSPAWFKAEEERAKAESEGRAADEEAWRKQRDYMHWLAEELRKASGLTDS